MLYLSLSSIWQNSDKRMLHVLLRSTSCDKTKPSVHREECKIQDKARVSLYSLRILIVKMPIGVIVEYILKKLTVSHSSIVFFSASSFLCWLWWIHVLFTSQRKRQGTSHISHILGTKTFIHHHEPTYLLYKIFLH